MPEVWGKNGPDNIECSTKCSKRKIKGVGHPAPGGVKCLWKTTGEKSHRGEGSKGEKKKKRRKRKFSVKKPQRGKIPLEIQRRKFGHKQQGSEGHQGGRGPRGWKPHY